VSRPATGFPEIQRVPQFRQRSGAAVDRDHGVAVHTTSGLRALPIPVAIAVSA